jgi:hypothetical protein
MLYCKICSGSILLRLQAVDYVQYDKPSPIQMASIPLGLKQLDVIGVAETGSGKTAAFVIPMLCYIMRQPVMDESNYAGGWICWLPLWYTQGSRLERVLTCCGPVAGVDAGQTRSQALRMWLPTGMVLTYGSWKTCTAAPYVMLGPGRQSCLQP